MSDTGLWRDYARSRAVLIGAWEYTHLTPVPAAHNSLKRMAGLLTGPLCGWPTQRVEVVGNARRRDRLPDRLMELFEGVVDVALFYFVGHGQVHGDELCLALRESPETGPRRLTVGLPFADVRAAIRECDARTKIVILDCCFAGHAARPQHSLTTASTDVIDKTLGTGAFTMAASGAYRTAWFETDPNAATPQTYFTQYLIDVIDHGVPGQPEDLTLGAIFAQTADALARDRRPEPTRSVRHDADRFILARNVAGPAVSPSTVSESSATPRSGAANPPSHDRPPPSTGPAGKHPHSWRPSRRTLLLAGLGTAVTAVAVPVGLNLASSPSFGSGSANTPGGRPRTFSGSAPVLLPTAENSIVSSAVFSRDGKTLAGSISDDGVNTSPAGAAMLWDVATQKNIATLNTNTHNVGSVAFSPDGQTLAVPIGDGTIKLWDVSTQQNTVTIDTEIYGVPSVAFSRDGETLASANRNGSGVVMLWDVATQEKIATINTHNTGSVAFSGDGKTLASSNHNSKGYGNADNVPSDGAVMLWDFATQKNIATLSTGTGYVRDVAFSRDGKIVASANDNGNADNIPPGGAVMLWEVATRKNIATLGTNTYNSGSVAFSPDGKTVASANDSYGANLDGTVMLWDVATQENTATLNTNTGYVFSVAFSPDGTRLASGGSKLLLWTSS